MTRGSSPIFLRMSHDDDRVFKAQKLHFLNPIPIRLVHEGFTRLT